MLHAKTAPFCTRVKFAAVNKNGEEYEHCMEMTEMKKGWTLWMSISETDEISQPLKSRGNKLNH